MCNRTHRFRAVLLCAGLCLAMVCQADFFPSDGLLAPAESGPGDVSHAMALCAHNPLLTSMIPRVEYPRLITPLAVVVVGALTQVYTLPFYRPPRPIA